MRSCYIVHGESINVSLLYLASDRDSPIYSGNNDNVIEQTIDVRPLPPSLFWTIKSCYFFIIPVNESASSSVKDVKRHYNIDQWNVFIPQVNSIAVFV